MRGWDRSQLIDVIGRCARCSGSTLHEPFDVADAGGHDGLTAVAGQLKQQWLLAHRMFHDAAVCVFIRHPCAVLPWQLGTGPPRPADRACVAEDRAHHARS